MSYYVTATTVATWVLAMAAAGLLAGVTSSTSWLVLVAGATKAEALRHVLERPGDWIKYPAAGVRLGMGSVIWWADREAAALADDKRASQ